MAILKHIASKSSSYGAALEYLIFKHDEIRKPTYKILSTQYTLKVESRGWKMPDRVCQRGVH